jgi:hypothetical protein
MMRQAIALLCSLIVGLQVVVGLAGLIGGVCFLAFSDTSLGPISVQLHAGHGEPLPANQPDLPLQASAAYVGPPGADAVQPPMNVVPDLSPAPGEASIVTLREEQGSLLAGTVFGQGLNPAAEQRLFVGALRQVAAEGTQAASASDQSASINLGCPAAAGLCHAIPTRQEAALFAVERLYEMADIDERVGEYERADRWRALARGLRQATVSDNLACPGEGPEHADDQAEPLAGAQELD